MLIFNKVSAEIDKITVLRDVEVVLNKGSVIGVVGRNGAGKTTLLRSVMGFVPLTKGSIKFEEEDLGKIPPYKRAKLGIGYAPQERVIFPQMSVEENLRFPCEVCNFSQKMTEKRLAITLEVVPQLKEMLPRSGATLSGGQGKMAALGRALMAGSKLILLDEPFQGLAPALAAQYSDSLKKMHEIFPDLCIVVTESNIGLLGDIPDQILKIERGEVQSTMKDKVALLS